VAAQSAPTKEQLLRLDIPNDAAQVATARLFASAVGRHVGVDEEGLEDLKLGVSEAATCAVQQGDPNGAIHIEARPTPERLHILVAWQETPGPGTASNSEADAVLEERTDLASLDDEPAMGFDLIRGLFEDARIDRGTDGVVRVAFSLTLSGAGG
jgi:anti-sigma regulatory factor (Ser/Thr protein kinase)